jgi:hypothetical protein
VEESRKLYAFAVAATAISRHGWAVNHAPEHDDRMIEICGYKDFEIDVARAAPVVGESKDAGHLHDCQHIAKVTYMIAGAIT